MWGILVHAATDACTCMSCSSALIGYRCSGKEHIFVADNHESCMVWLKALQVLKDLPWLTLLVAISGVAVSYHKNDV